MILYDTQGQHQEVRAQVDDMYYVIRDTGNGAYMLVPMSNVGPIGPFNTEAAAVGPWEKDSTGWVRKARGWTEIQPREGYRLVPADRSGKEVWVSNLVGGSFDELEMAKEAVDYLLRERGIYFHD